MNEPFLMRVDDPADQVLCKSTCRVRGWYAVPAWVDASQIKFRIDDAPVPWQAQARPDVAAEHLELFVAGFIIDLDLSQHFYAIRSGEISLSIVFPRAPEMKVQFYVAPRVAADCLAAAASV